MDPALYSLLEPVVVLSTLLGVAFGVKILVWGKGPIKRLRGGDPHLEERLADFEDRLDQSTELISRQADQILDLEERLDFTERLLTKGKHDTAPEQS